MIDPSLTWALPFVSALIKQVNKSIDGTADDEDEGVPTDLAIRAGLELLKVKIFYYLVESCFFFLCKYLNVSDSR